VAAPGRRRPAAVPAGGGRVGRPRRRRPALYLDRGGGSIQVLPAGDDPETGEAAARALGALVEDGRTRELVLTKVDGGPVAESPFRERLIAAGFIPGYRGLVLRRAVDRPGGPVSRGPVARARAGSSGARDR
jgi:hypothetical protein